MKTNKHRENTLSNEEIHKQVMEAKSLLDTIAEMKSLESDHDLCLASNHLDNFLDALEAQFPELVK